MRLPPDTGLGHAAQRAEAAAACAPCDVLTPADRYGELFEQVQRTRLFPDSKTFVDCPPRIAPEAIVEAYRRERTEPGFDLADFVQRHFEPTHEAASGYRAEPGLSIEQHIDALWPVLERQPQAHRPCSSQLPLPHPYVVPGGRFVEMYYWDSYFTMLGLQASGRCDLVHAMTDNFAWLIDAHGHVPDGTRTYYLSRSQPPVFALMVALCEACGGPPAVGYLPQLLREHAWWMAGESGLAPGQAHRRVVRLPDGAVLNRYWDDRDTPREEAHAEDIATAALSQRPAREVWRDLRAAAESGWDFSTRWHEQDAHGVPARELHRVRTTSIVPVDLNALLFALEDKIAQLAAGAGDGATARAFAQRAAARTQAVRRLCWDAGEMAFFDLALPDGARRRCLTAAAIVPLFTGLADAAQAAATAHTIAQRLLAPGGLGTTELESAEQWDRPNGWAPLQWMAFEGFLRYGHHDLAHEIARRWLATVGEVYGRELKLVEKYALREPSHPRTEGGHGGEYPLQDGFGWTNGVTRALLARMNTRAQA